MRKYQIARIDAIVLAGACWFLATGLAVEKVLKDGVSSYTLLAAMPILTLAVGVLLHQGFEDIRDMKWLRGPTALMLACLCLAVTLPASIGSSGQARDAALAEAKKSSDDIAKLRVDLAKAEKLVAEAQNWAADECKTGKGYRCEGIVFTLYQREAAAEKLRKELKSEQPKVANSGEHRIAWALGMAGFKVAEGDVQMIWPMLPPVAFELLCAFLMCAGLERRTVRDSRMVAEAPVVIEPVTAGEYAGILTSQIATSSDLPTPPKPKKRTKRQQRKDRVLESIRRHTQKYGTPPKFSVVRNRHRLPQTTAHRYLKQATA